VIGDWGLGIGDCPIPNPQSPIPTNTLKYFNYDESKSSNIFNN